jgi:hypothetical protein
MYDFWRHLEPLTRQYTTLTVLDIIRCPVFYLKQSVSETGLCFRLQVEPTQLGRVDRVSYHQKLIDHQYSCWRSPGSRSLMWISKNFAITFLIISIKLVSPDGTPATYFRVQECKDSRFLFKGYLLLCFTIELLYAFVVPLYAIHVDLTRIFHSVLLQY